MLDISVFYDNAVHFAALGKLYQSLNARTRKISPCSTVIKSLNHLTTFKFGDLGDEVIEQITLIFYRICKYLLVYCASNNIQKGAIFTGRDGNSAISTSTVWREIHSLSKKTDIDKKKLHPHNCRHYYASQFMKIVNELNVLRGLLGHSDIKTTTIYTHRDGNFIRECVNKIVA